MSQLLLPSDNFGMGMVLNTNTVNCTIKIQKRHHTQCKSMMSALKIPLHSAGSPGLQLPVCGVRTEDMVLSDSEDTEDAG